MRDTLTKIDGVKSVQVDFGEKTASVKLDSSVTDAQKVAKELSARTNRRYTAEVKD